MKKFIKRWSTIIVIALYFAFIFIIKGDSLYQNNETFHVDYLQETTEAVHADGETVTTLLFETSATFDANPIITTMIEGVKVGNGNASLSYETQNNLPTTIGSIEIRFRPIDWEVGENTDYTIFQVNDLTPYPPAKLTICKNGANNILISFSNGTFNVSFNNDISEWQNNISQHLIFTYNNKGDVILYINGVEVKRATIGTLQNPATITWPTIFSVGPSYTGFGYYDGQTAIERVRIYDMELDSDAVSYLNACTEFDHLIGATSDWLNEGRPQLGLTALDKNIVPSPWTNVSYSSSVASCWNRDYNFSDDNILTDALSDNISMLSGPIALKINAGTLTFGTPSVITAESGNGCLVLERSGSFGGISATLKYTLTYDGLLWCELGLTPNGTTISSLMLRIPFTKSAAQLTHYVGAPMTLSSYDYPYESYSKSLSLASGVKHESEFKIMVWVGDNNRGLLWCTESDQYWWPKDRNDCIKLERLTNGNLNLDISMVSSSLPVNAPENLTYKFGIMGTPVKSIPTGWRNWTTNFGGTWTGDYRGVNVIYWLDQYRFMNQDFDPTRYINISQTQTKIITDHNDTPRRYILPYFNVYSFLPRSVETDPNNPLQTVTKRLPEESLMLREWGALPNYNFPLTSMRISYDTGLVDYVVWCVDNFYNVMGQIDGYYLDGPVPVPNSREETCGGYDALNQTRRPTFNFFPIRDLIKRLNYNIGQRNSERPRSLAHISSTQGMNWLAEADILLIGEQYNINYLYDNPELKPPAGNEVEEVYYYSYALPMDRLRAECFGRQWGAVMTWLPQLNESAVLNNPISTRDMLSRIMQADMNVIPSRCKSSEVFNTWTFRSEYGIGGSNVDFHPYWEQSSIIVRAAHLLAWWKLNDNIGTDALDSSGLDHSATLANMNTPSCWTSGIASKGLQFSNDGGYVDCSTISELSTASSYTVSCWIKPDTNSVSSRYIVKAINSQFNAGFFMQLNSYNTVSFYQAVDGNIGNLSLNTAFPHDDEYHHVAVTFDYDGTTCTLRLYLDGILTGTDYYTGTPDFVPANVALKIGEGAFAGVIDDVKVFSKMLSSSEITYEYKDIKKVISIAFNDSKGTMAKDLSSHDIDGMLNGMTNPWTMDYAGRAIKFSNDGGYVDCGTISELSTASSYTVSCWIKPDTNSVSSRHIVKAINSQFNAGFFMQLNSYNTVSFYQAVDGNIGNLSLNTAFPHDDEYHHVAVTFDYDGTTCTLRLYLDGILTGTDYYTGTPDFVPANVALKIGEGAFSGNLKDVRINTRILSSAEIALESTPFDSSNNPPEVVGYYSNSSGEYLAIISNLNRFPRTVFLNFGDLNISSVKDAETTNALQLNSKGELMLKMNRNDYRAIRINY